MKINNIIFIGMMGTGKTTIGKALSQQIGWKWTDTDEEIVKRTGKTIPDLFLQNGEQAFRDLETSVLSDLLLSRNRIITTGGGIVLKQLNRQMMRQGGWVVGLKAPVEVLIERVKNDQNRPLLQGNLEERMNTLYNERAPLYDFADLMIDTSESSIEAIVHTITEFLKRTEQ
jgi:shikimate kinase